MNLEILFLTSAFLTIHGSLIFKDRDTTTTSTTTPRPLIETVTMKKSQGVGNWEFNVHGYKCNFYYSQKEQERMLSCNEKRCSIKNAKWNCNDEIMCSTTGSSSLSATCEKRKGNRTMITLPSRVIKCPDGKGPTPTGCRPIQQ